MKINLFEIMDKSKELSFYLLDEFDWSEMVLKSFIIMLIPFQFLSLFFMLKKWVNLWFVCGCFINVALIVSTRMLFPSSSANPAKLKPATPWGSASHVIASLILKNCCFTLWALFCICDDPNHVNWGIFFFESPFFSCITVTWGVGFLGASCAKFCLTSRALFITNSLRVCNFERIFTTVLRAPLQIWIVICKVKSNEMKILLLVF